MTSSKRRAKTSALEVHLKVLVIQKNFESSKKELDKEEEDCKEIKDHK
jgi:hypothetical protein